MTRVDRLVSIVTPAYKAEKLISETIRSVQAQSYSYWEMIVVDDGSPDLTAEIVSDFAANDSRIQLICQSNSGPAMARQRALNYARGQYIAFLDSDDLWLPDKLEKQLAFMIEEGAPFTYTSFRRINADASELGHLINVPKKMTYYRLLGNTAIATSTVMINLDVTGELIMTNTYYDDFVLWLNILKRGFIAKGLNEDLMRYRVMEDSVSRNKFKSALMVWYTFRKVEKLSFMASFLFFISYAFHALVKYNIFKKS